MFVVARITSQEEKQDQVKNILQELAVKVQEEAGTLIYTLHCNQNDPNVFLVYEKYRDLDALMEHSSTDHFKAAMRDLTPLLADKPVIEMYDEL